MAKTAVFLLFGILSLAAGLAVYFANLDSLTEYGVTVTPKAFYFRGKRIEYADMGAKRDDTVLGYMDLYVEHTGEKVTDVKYRIQDGIVEGVPTTTVNDGNFKMHTHSSAKEGEAPVWTCDELSDELKDTYGQYTANNFQFHPYDHEDENPHLMYFVTQVPVPGGIVTEQGLFDTNDNSILNIGQWEKEIFERGTPEDITLLFNDNAIPIPSGDFAQECTVVTETDETGGSNTRRRLTALRNSLRATQTSDKPTEAKEFKDVDIEKDLRQLYDENVAPAGTTVGFRLIDLIVSVYYNTYVDDGLADVTLSNCERMCHNYDCVAKCDSNYPAPGSVWFAFTGTDNPLDWMNNFDASWHSWHGGVKVHNGFYTEAAGGGNFWPWVDARMPAEDKYTFFMGHSLGGAIAQLHAFRQHQLHGRKPDFLKTITIGGPAPFKSTTYDYKVTNWQAWRYKMYERGDGIAAVSCEYQYDHYDRVTEASGGAGYRHHGTEIGFRRYWQGTYILGTCKPYYVQEIISHPQVYAAVGLHSSAYYLRAASQNSWVKPDFENYLTCRVNSLWSSFGQEGWSGCANENTQVMKGLYRNDCDDLSCIELASCCEPGISNTHALYARTTIWEPAQITWADSNQWFVCPNGYFMTKIWRKSPSTANDNTAITDYRCIKDASWSGYGECVDHDIRSQFDYRNWASCPGDTYLAGLYQSNYRNLYNIETMKCCSKP